MPRGKFLMMKLKTIFILTAVIAFFTVFAAGAQSLHGDATYYGNKFHGRYTSDGSRYHKDSLTCAHRTLPFGTLLKVRNKKNGKEVVVKVTDRGPFRRGGIVDLSMAAARKIDMVSAGVVPVEVVRMGHVSEGLSVASFDNKQAQENLMPEQKYLDPVSGKYFTMAEWNENGGAKLEVERKRVALEQRSLYLSKVKLEPRWRILKDKMTAKNIVVK